MCRRYKASAPEKGTGSIPWRSIRSITAHSHDLCREIGAFGGTGELHLLLDRCVGQRARGTCCPPFLLCFENRVNGEWAEEKEVLIRSRTLEQCGRLENGSSPWGRQNHRRSLSSFFLERRAPWYVIKNGRKRCVATSNGEERRRSIIVEGGRNGQSSSQG